MSLIEKIFKNKTAPNITGIDPNRNPTINHQQQPPGGRDLGVYEAQLMFRRENLSHKVVLDLGAGPQCKLQQQLAQSGIPATVISLSPDFRTGKFFTTLAHVPRKIAALGQYIPFKDNSIDIILALHMLEHAPLEKIIPEVCRILKKGGEARIGPFWDSSHSTPTIETTRRELLSYGAYANEILIPIHVIPLTSPKDITGWRDRYVQKKVLIISK